MTGWHGVPDFYTPWGDADHIDALGDGVLIVDTPSHGGAFIPAELLRRIPEPFFKYGSFSEQRRIGWFEEDCDIAICVTFLPEYFSERFSAVSAMKSIRQWHAEALKESSEPH